MGWDETGRYYAALREIETELDRGGTVAWLPGYADVFGSRAVLDDALRLRWTRLVQAQVSGPADLAALVAAHPGLHAAVSGVPMTPAGPRRCVVARRVRSSRPALVP